MVEERMRLLEGLTEAQARAVTTHRGPLLVLIVEVNLTTLVGADILKCQLGARS